MLRSAFVLLKINVAIGHGEDQDFLENASNGYRPISSGSKFRSLTKSLLRLFKSALSGIAIRFSLINVNSAIRSKQTNPNV